MGTLEEIVYPVVDAVQDLLKPGAALAKSPDSPLYGPGAPLDSLGLVNFVVAVEEAVEAKRGSAIRLVSEKAMSRRQSPFRTLQTLADYVDELLRESVPPR